MSKRSDELWTRQARAGALQEPNLALLLGVEVVPSLPALGETLLHNAAHALLAKGLDTLVTLLLEPHLGEARLLLLLTAALGHRLACLVELRADLCELLLGHGALLDLSTQKLLVGHGCLSSHVGLPIPLPMHKGRDESGPRETSASGLEQLLLALVLGVHVVPRLEAASNALLHDTPHAHLAEVLHALLALSLELLLHLALEVRLVLATLSDGRLSLSELCSQLVDQTLHVISLSVVTRHGLVEHLLLALCQLLHDGRAPHELPVHEGGDELGTRQACARAQKQPLLAIVLIVHVKPRLKATGDALLHEASDTHLLQVLHALLLLLLHGLHQVLFACGKLCLGLRQVETAGCELGLAIVQLRLRSLPQRSLLVKLLL